MSVERECIIEFRNVTKRYGDKLVMPPLNLCIERGEFVTVVGSSGCGKTTLLKMINGLELPNEGDVLVEGKNIRHENLIELRRNIGYAIQGNNLFPHMTVEKNISYVPNLLNKKDKRRTKQALEDCLETVGIQRDWLARYPDELSGGQQQRVGLARAIAAKPYILLMDEPFGALDEMTRRQMQHEIKAIHERADVTIVFVTHDIGEALRLGTKVLVMRAGEVVRFASPDTMRDEPPEFFV